jgi:fatty acid desaturase
VTGLAPLLFLQWRTIANRYWRTPRLRITTTLILAGTTGLGIGVAYFIRDWLFDPAVLVDPATGWMIFAAVAALISFAALTESMTLVIPRFYRSPDLNYLLALPIPAERIVAMKFLAAQFQSSRAVLFVSLIGLVAIGWSVGAPWYYYAALPVVFWVFTLVPAGLGLLIGMALLRVMTARALNRLALGLSLGSFILWWALLTLPPELLMPLLARAVDLVAWLGHVPADLVPPVAAGRLLSALAVADPVRGLGPLAMLLAVTGAAMALIFWLARHLFYQGWLRTQSAPVAQPSAAPRSKARPTAHARPPLLAALLTSWRQALRNSEARLVAIGVLVGYVTLVAVLADGGLLGGLGESPWLALVVLILGAAILLPMGIETLFLPFGQVQQAGASKATALLKRTLWLSKVLPLTTTEVVLVAVLRTAAVTFCVGAAGILIYGLLAEVGFLYVLVAVVGLLLLVLGSLVGSTGHEYWSYARTEKINPLISSWSGLFLFAAYFAVAAGPLTLYLAAEVIPGLAGLRTEGLLVGGLISWPVVSLLSIWGGWKLAFTSWEELEFE